MSQVISVRISDADFKEIEAQAQNAQLKTATFVADILHAHLKGKATCSSCGDPVVVELRSAAANLRLATESMNVFMRGQQFTSRKTRC